MMQKYAGPKPAERSSGDWNCTHCGHVNFETKDTCTKCKEEGGEGGEQNLNQARSFMDYKPQKRARKESVNPLVDLAREMDEEKRKRAVVEMQRSRKLLICGDVRGQYEQTFKMVAMQDNKVGPFEVVLCVGAFLPGGGTFVDTGKTDAHLKGETASPIECYFIDTSPAIIQAAPAGATLGKNLHFLGAYGVRIIRGLRIAFLSGRYNAAVYDTLDVDFVGGAYTKRAVHNLKKIISDDKKGIDLLLTSDWPATITRHLTEVSQKPPELLDVQSWEVVSSPLVADLCQAVGPRYHVFASAKVFYQRPLFQTRHGRFSCRCIGLGSVGNPLSKQQKWIHALSLSPVEHMSAEELRKQSIGSLASPFTEEGKEHEAETIIAAQTLDNTKLHEQTLTCLRDGDVRQYLEIVETLKDGKFSWR